MDKKDFIGIRGLSGNLPAGIGFVIIPENVDIEEYKQDVYNTGRISIFGGYGHSNFYNVHIDRESLQRVKFPKKSGEMGSPVVWINIPKHNEVVVVACLKYDKDFFSHSENRKRITATDSGNIVDVDLDAKKGTISISGNGVTERMVMNIELTDKNKDAIFQLKVNGQILTHSTQRTINASQGKIENLVTDLDGTIKAKSSLSPDETERYTYEDEYENKVSVSEEKIEIRADKSSKINFGDGNEPLVLGNMLKEILEKYDDALAKMTVPTAFGPSGTRINDAEFRLVRKDFEKFLSKLTNTD